MGMNVTSQMIRSRLYKDAMKEGPISGTWPFAYCSALMGITPVPVLFAQLTKISSGLLRLPKQLLNFLGDKKEWVTKSGKKLKTKHEV